MERKKITFDSFIRGVIIGAIIIGILMLLERLSGVLLPFFIAWLIAYLIYPLVTFFQYKLRLKNRVVSIFCALLSIVLVGVAAFFLLVPPMIEEFGRVKDLLIEYFSSTTTGGNVPKSLSDFLRENIDTRLLIQIFNEKDLLAALKETLPGVWTILSESVNLLFSVFTFFIILLYIVFILLDYESISEGWPYLVPVKYRKFVTDLLNDVKNGMNRYFRGQAFVALCVGILFSIGFLIIDFPMAIGLGLFIGALNLVPYLQIIGFIPTIILAILKAADTGGNFWLILAAALAVFVVVQIIQDGFIVPRVMGKITGLNPAIILLSLSVWGSLMGMLGMIIALPLTTLMLSYYQRFIINREKISKVEITDNQETCKKSDIEDEKKSSNPL
ncbi:AI-2E family transporter [Bacteroides ndongoniae]|uniref:AI-2E family transporter n=1 Tax=Bacteroides ndongoniae TaxID=1903262 RepID=UPI0008D9DC74|nr:AI-2E family transporter [Bacteroides ndongoniae]